MSTKDLKRPVVIHNAETGQTMTTTAHKFDSLYCDKGFELVDRNNVDKASGSGRQAAATKPNLSRPTRGSGSGETAETTSSAASIAKEIGLDAGSDQTPDPNADPMTAAEGAADTKKRNAETPPAK